MSQITDRELLAFFSLAKLKLEFSKYSYEEEEQGKKIEKYPTIRQLIDLELAGQFNRAGANITHTEVQDIRDTLSKLEANERSLTPSESPGMSLREHEYEKKNKE